MANEVMVANQATKNAIALAVGNSISKEKFDSLDAIIENIGKFSGDVDDATREHGLEYIDQWKELVLRRIDDKVYKLNELIDFFDRSKLCNSICNGEKHIAKELLERIDNDVYINVVNTIVGTDKNYTDKLKDYTEDIENFLEWFEDNKPAEEVVDTLNTTPSELTAIKLAYDLKEAKFKAKARSKIIKIFKGVMEITNKINREPKIKKFVKEVKKQITAVIDIRSLAKEKASIAKMNMIIPNADLRKCLRELSDFQKTI